MVVRECGRVAHADMQRIGDWGGDFQAIPGMVLVCPAEAGLGCGVAGSAGRTAADFGRLAARRGRGGDVGRDLATWGGGRATWGGGGGWNQIYF